MTTWYLQKGREPDPDREFIDDRVWEGCVEIATADAETWKEARAELVP